MKYSASAPNVSVAVHSDTGSRPRTASFASGDTRVADDVVDVTNLKGQELVSSIGVSPLDLADICNSRERAAHLPRDVLPDILYGDADCDTTCHNSVVTSYHRPLVQLKSSESYCSDLTDLTHVDDGLTDWGLPKVLVPSYDDEDMVFEEQSLTAASLPQDAPSELDIESIFDVDLALPTEAQLRNETIVKTMSVVYLGLLLQRKGIKPARYQQAEPQTLRTRKSLAELCAENKARQVEASFLASFVPVWL